MKRQKKLSLMLLSIAGGLTVLCGAGYQAGFRFNTGISYPSGLYRLTPDVQQYRTGDLVLFCPPNNVVTRMALTRGYLKHGPCPGGFMSVIKKVMATGGDDVTFGRLVSINAIPVPGIRMQVADSQGRPLPLPPPLTLLPDTYFMLSDHRPVVSFDSRYYGPVPAKNVIGHIHPVFTW